MACLTNEAHYRTHLLGKYVKSSDAAEIYNTGQIDIDQFSGVYNFCVVSERVVTRKYDCVRSLAPAQEIVLMFMLQRGG